MSSFNDLEIQFDAELNTDSIEKAMGSLNDLAKELGESYKPAIDAVQKMTAHVEKTEKEGQKLSGSVSTLGKWYGKAVVAASKFRTNNQALAVEIKGMNNQVKSIGTSFIPAIEALGQFAKSQEVLTTSIQKLSGFILSLEASYQPGIQATRTLLEMHQGLSTEVRSLVQQVTTFREAWLPITDLVRQIRIQQQALFGWIEKTKRSLVLFSQAYLKITGVLREIGFLQEVVRKELNLLPTPVRKLWKELKRALSESFQLKSVFNQLSIAIDRLSKATSKIGKFVRRIIIPASRLLLAFGGLNPILKKISAKVEKITALIHRMLPPQVKILLALGIMGPMIASIIINMKGFARVVIAIGKGFGEMAIFIGKVVLALSYIPIQLLKGLFVVAKFTASILRMIPSIAKVLNFIDAIPGAILKGLSNIAQFSKNLLVILAKVALFTLKIPLYIGLIPIAFIKASFGVAKFLANILRVIPIINKIVGFIDAIPSVLKRGFTLMRLSAKFFIKGLFSALGDGLKFIGDSLKNAFTIVKSSMGGFLSSLGNGFRAFFGKVKDFGGDVILSVLDIFKAGFSRLPEIISTGTSKLSSVFKSIFSLVRVGAGKALTFIGNRLGDLFQLTKSGIGLVLKKTLDLTKSFFSILPGIRAIGSGIASWGVNIGQALLSLPKMVLGFGSSSGAIGRIKAGLIEIGSTVASLVPAIAKKALAFAKAIPFLGKIVSLVRKIPGFLGKWASVLTKVFGAVASGIGKMLKGLGLVGIAIFGVQQAFKVLNKIVTAVVDQVKTRRQASIWGITDKEVQALSKSLGHAKTKMELLQTASELRMSGFSAKQSAAIGKMAVQLSVLTKESEESTLTALKNGSLSAKMLKGLVISQAQLQAEIAKATPVGQEADDRIRALASMNLVRKRLEGIGGDLLKMAEKSPIQGMMTNFRALGQTILKDLGPVILQFANWLRSNSKQISGYIKVTIALTIQMAKVAQKVVGWVIKKISSAWSALMRLLPKSIRKSFSSIDKSFNEIYGYIAKGAVEAYGAQTDAAKKSAEEQKKSASKVSKHLRNLVKNNQSANISAKATVEAKREIQGFATEARTQVRNFNKTMTSALSSVGGSIASVASKQGELFQKFRMFSLVYGKGLQKTIGLNRDQIVQLEKQGQITKRQSKAAQIMQAFRVSTQRSLFASIRSEKQLTFQVKSRLSSLSSENQLNSVRIERAKQLRTTMESMPALRQLISRAEKRHNLAQIKYDKARQSGHSRSMSRAMTELAFFKERIKQTKSFRKEFVKTNQERMKGLNALLTIAKIERKSEIAERNLSFRKQEVGIEGKLLDLRRTNARILGSIDPKIAIQTNTVKQIREIGFALESLDTQLEKQESKVLLAIGKENVNIESQRLILLNKQKDSLKEQINLIQAGGSLQAKIAGIQSTEKDVLKRIMLSKQESSAMQKLMDLRRTNAEFSGPIDPRLTIPKDAEKRIKNIRFELEELIAKQITLQEKSKLLTDKTQIDLSNKQLAGMAATLAMRRQEIELIREGVAAQIQSLTVSGQLSKKFREDQMSFAANIASVLHSSFQETVSAFGSSISNMFQSLVSTGEMSFGDLGKGFLDVLSSMALKMGSMLLLAGAGFAAIPPFTGGAAIVAGLGLLALGGTLKGASSLIGSSSSGAQATPKAPPTSDNNFSKQLNNRPDKELGSTTTNLYINTVPWRKNDPKDFRNFDKWKKAGNRQINGMAKA